uniref:NADH-ubiquinone oxidoreductase chain 2 n=1 Tax=Lamprigera yunnana TaxID=370605 RepID=A0A5C0PXC0_9COLE|nr:NADH dehydrogenase subunit 2 [Lamprigera yunnana]QEJ81500.1 NADH dehydrogenase subunit 2 [Lamprigera yunnana]
MEKFYKIMFYSTLIISTLMTISSYSWMIMWMGLEINLMSMIPLIQFYKNIYSIEASIKYFIVQVIASTIILMTIIVMMWKHSFSSSIMENYSLLILNSSLFMKMGMAPFHIWFPEVIEGLSWTNCMIMLTWQKIAPMTMIMLNINYSVFFSSIIISSTLISGIMIMNQTSMRKILAYSSISHMGWMTATMMCMQTIWMWYFIIYTFTTINIIALMKMNKIYFINQLHSLKWSNPLNKILYSLNFLSLGGIPPLPGFFPKWLTIQFMMQENMTIISSMMIISTLMTIYIYSMISISSMTMSLEEKLFKISFKNPSKMILSFLNFTTIFSLILMTSMYTMT